MSKVVDSRFDSETSVGKRPEPGLPTQIVQPEFEGRKTGQEALRATAEAAWKSFPVCATFIHRGPEMGSDRVQRLLTVQMQFSKYVSGLYCSIYFSGTFSLLFITCFYFRIKHSCDVTSCHCELNVNGGRLLLRYRNTSFMNSVI